MEVRDRVKIYFYDRAPNSILEDHILLEFPDEPGDAVTDALSQLVDEGFLVANQKSRHPRLSHSVGRASYRISEGALGDYPINTELEVAGIRIPRLIDGDTARAEDVNSLIYSVDKIIESRTAALKEQMERESKKYWEALITIFALFVSLFSIINIGIKPALFAEELGLSPWAIAVQSAANIAPMAVVLLLFAWLLHKIIRR